MHFKERGAKTSMGAVAVVGVVILIAAVLVSNPNIFQGSALQVNTPTGSFTPATTQVTTGAGLKAGDQLTVTLNHRDALTEASLTEATNVKTTLLSRTAEGTFNVVTTGSGQTYTVGSDGKIWLSFETQASGQSYIWAKDRTIAANPGMFNAADAAYVDIDADGTKEWVISVTTAGLDSQRDLSGTKPDRSLNIKWHNEASLTASSPSDLSTVGSTANTAKFIEWEPTGTAGDASYIAKVTLKWNQTDESEIDQSQSYCTIDGQQFALSSATNKVNDGSNLTWEWFYGWTIDKAKVVEFPQNTNAKTDMTCKVVVSMDEDDDYLFDLDVYTLSETEAVSSINDQVEMEENA